MKMTVDFRFHFNRNAHTDHAQLNKESEIIKEKCILYEHHEK